MVSGSTNRTQHSSKPTYLTFRPIMWNFNTNIPAWGWRENGLMLPIILGESRQLRNILGIFVALKHTAYTHKVSAAELGKWANQWCQCSQVPALSNWTKQHLAQQTEELVINGLFVQCVGYCYGRDTRKQQCKFCNFFSRICKVLFVCFHCGSNVCLKRDKHWQN